MKTRFSLVTTLSLIFGLFLTNGNAAEFLEITGELKVQSYHETDAEGKPVKAPQTYAFKCIVSTNEWFIESHFARNAIQEFYFNGTNVLSRVTRTDKVPIDFGPGMPLDAGPSGRPSLRLIQGAHPLSHLGANVPWLAYCSGKYLRKKERVVPLPIVHGSMYRFDSFAYADETTVFPDALGLPSSMELKTSKAQFSKGLKDKRLKRTFHLEDERSLKFFSKDGITVCRYRVLESTNIGGWVLPLGFELIQNRKADEEAWTLSAVIEGRANTIQEFREPLPTEGMEKLTE